MCISAELRYELELSAISVLIGAAAGYAGTSLLTNLPAQIGGVYGGVFVLSFSIISPAVAYCFPSMNKTIQYVLSFFASVWVSSYLTSAITGASVTFGIGLMLSIATIIPLAILILWCCPERIPGRA